MKANEEPQNAKRIVVKKGRVEIMSCVGGRREGEKGGTGEKRGKKGKKREGEEW